MEATGDVMRPVPRPFSIEALIGDEGTRRAEADGGVRGNEGQWTAATAYGAGFQHRRDTDSEGSLDLDLAQDLSRQSQKDGEQSNVQVSEVFIGLLYYH